MKPDSHNNSVNKVEKKADEKHDNFDASLTVIGIDLGTTNCALAYWQRGIESGSKKLGDIGLLAIPQVIQPGIIAAKTLLPSFMYIPIAGEISSQDACLPWSTDLNEPKPISPPVIGVWAKERGSLTPEHLIVSAKSWLTHQRVDRSSAILPWNSPMTTGKCSPIEASSAYLKHLMAAFDSTKFSKNRSPKGDEVTENQNIQTVLTVPASFDDVARSLTYRAAVEAGLTHITLLEEPLAAFYAWLDDCGESWREVLKPGDIVLVCDIGGGTTDFSLIKVNEDSEGHLSLERISVGEHLLLGGDNMDLALATFVRSELEKTGHQIDRWQFLSLVASVRSAKEQILGDSKLESVNISIANRGASLFKQTISTTITRVQVEQVLIEGFLPLTAKDEIAQKRRSTGIQEIGLSYETDPAISRHLARFLARSHQNLSSLDKLDTQKTLGSGGVVPTAVLFNGGVFRASLFKKRILDLLAKWHDNNNIKELSSFDLDTAVARGATCYGRLRATGRGIRVASGTARSYYIGLDSPVPAIPGLEPPVKGLCLVAQGTDEGTAAELKEQEFGLIVGESVEFRFFSSNIRAGDRLGTIIEDASYELDETSRLQVTLTPEGYKLGDLVPVNLGVKVTEVGTLQLSLNDVTKGHHWNLEFDVRDS